MTDEWKILSPNDWMVKAGAYVAEGRLFQPHDFLIMPMTIASEAIVLFRASNNYKDRMRHALTITLTVRIADTALYTKIAKMYNSRNPKKPNICQHCIRGQIFKTKMKELRKKANNKIIHEMEKGKIMLNPDDLNIAYEYYEEIFNLPLMDPIHIPEVKNLVLCCKCRKKWGFS